LLVAALVVWVSEPRTHGDDGGHPVVKGRSGTT
jgi:hypothetical protein